MKRLTLVRHATAAWKAPESTDFDRPLTRRGLAEAVALGGHLLTRQLTPDLLIASPARRARQTAEIIGRELALAANTLKFDESLYLAQPAEMLSIVHAQGPRLVHLMIVGHNPGLSELARLLAPRENISELDTAVACTICFEAAEWRNLTPGSAKEAHCESRAPRLLGLWP